MFGVVKQYLKWVYELPKGCLEEKTLYGFVIFKNLKINSLHKSRYIPH